ASFRTHQPRREEVPSGSPERNQTDGRTRGGDRHPSHRIEPSKIHARVEEEDVMNVRQRIAASTVSLLLLVAGAGLGAEGVVNINTASESQLSLLPRVGPSLAKKIVETRQAKGA